LGEEGGRLDGRGCGGGSRGSGGNRYGGRFGSWYLGSLYRGRPAGRGGGRAGCWRVGHGHGRCVIRGGCRCTDWRRCGWGVVRGHGGELCAGGCRGRRRGVRRRQIRVGACRCPAHRAHRCQATAVGGLLFAARSRGRLLAWREPATPAAGSAVVGRRGGRSVHGVPRLEHLSVGLRTSSVGKCLLSPADGLLSCPVPQPMRPHSTRVPALYGQVRRECDIGRSTHRSVPPGMDATAA